MNRPLAAILLTLAALAAALALVPGGAAQAPTAPTAPAAPAADAQPQVRFTAVDVLLDTGGAPLAAYQVEVTAPAAVTLVGIEGGEHAAFRQPPHYDPRALGQQRVILGAFNTGSDLPAGRTRVARLMVRVTGDAPPAYPATVQVAASPDGKAIPAAAVSVSPSEGADR